VQQLQSQFDFLIPGHEISGLNIQSIYITATMNAKEMNHLHGLFAEANSPLIRVCTLIYIVVLQSSLI